MSLDWRALASGLLAGLLIGAGLGWRAAGGSARRHRQPDRLMDRFCKRLDLSPEQRTQLRAILESKRERVAAMRRELRPRFDEVRAGAKAEIRAILRPEQLPRFEKLQAEWEARLEKRRPGGREP